MRNGSINRWSQDGVQASQAHNSQFLDLRVSDSGLYGLVCGEESVVVRCVARSNGETGIETLPGCVVRECTSSRNGGTGILVRRGSTVSHCSVINNQGHGIHAQDVCTVTECAASTNGGNGIHADNSTVSKCTSSGNGGNGVHAVASTVSECTASENDANGIEVVGSCHVTGCVAHENELAGFRISGDGNRIDGNSANHNGVGGFIASTELNFIFRNMAILNSTNLIFPINYSPPPRRYGAYPNLS